jgi:hypothetical protein
MMRIGMKSQENQKLTTKRLREYNFIMESTLQSPALEEIIRSLKGFPIDLLKIYPRSFCPKDRLWYGLIRTQGGKKLVVMRDRSDVLKDDKVGKHLFRDQLYHILMQYEEDYWSLLEKHIEKHLSSLGAERKDQS